MIISYDPVSGQITIDHEDARGQETMQVSRLVVRAYTSNGILRSTPHREELEVEVEDLGDRTFLVRTESSLLRQTLTIRRFGEGVHGKTLVEM
jgi:hypothetical protein